MPYYIKKKKKEPLFDKGLKVKKKPDLKAKLDKVFSMYIRLRDSKLFEFKYFKCISCGQIKPFAQADCGHYFSRTHLSTRFDANNCNAECRHCNRFKADHLEGYRVNLINKIGQQKFDLLKVKASNTSKMTDFEYEQLIKYYTDLIKRLKQVRYVRDKSSPENDRIKIGD